MRDAYGAAFRLVWAVSPVVAIWPPVALGMLWTGYPTWLALAPFAAVPAIAVGALVVEIGRGYLRAQ